ncbi:hypothetical protein GE061_010686 [Apolygus lucorum]|uniref:Serine/threonine-protein kinase ATM n=1 Tax=Apolygus lucorum TaxID=248454 RepID=A0A8S9XVL9_APOLU|nr:hypothetical protein GE061_010686 [Apolygus lucorum]
MNYNGNLNELLSGLEGPAKVPKHRKDQLSQLQDFLDIPGYVQQLNTNGNKRGTVVTWDRLFAAVHRMIIDETAPKSLNELAKKGKDFGPHHQAFMRSCSALALLAARANARSVYLSCHDTISCCLEAFEQPRFRDILSETYMGILSHSVLCKREYWGLIETDTWSDLLSASLVLFDEAKLGKPKVVILSCINLICFHGSRLSGFNKQLEKMLEFASNLISKALTDLYVLQSGALQLCFTLCHQLKKEFRYTVCKFGEEIMPHLIAMYEASCGDIARKKELLANMILEILSIHHPCGVLAKAPGAYAHDWDSWINHLNEIYSCLSEELDSRMGIARVDSNLMSTILLLVDVYKQISALGEPAESEFSQFGSPSSPKRRKVLRGIESVLDNIKLSGSDELWTWLCFMEKLLYKYPESVTAHEFEMIFVYLVDALPLSTAPTAITWTYKCTTALVHALKLFSGKLSFEKSYLTKELDKFMAISISALKKSKKIGTKYLDDAHMLVQSLLLSGYCSAPSVQSVLDIYLENLVPLDSNVLDTLLVLCHVSTFPETSPVRGKLLQWMIGGKDLDKVCMAKKVGLVSVKLLCRSKNDAIPSSLLPLERAQQFAVEELYVLGSSLDAPPNRCCSLEVDSEEVFDCNSVIEILKEPFMNILEERTKDMEMMNDPVVILCHTMLIHSFHIVTCGGGKWEKSWETLFNRSVMQLVSVLVKQFKNSKTDEQHTGLAPGLLHSTVEFFKTVKATPKLTSEIGTNELSKYIFRLLRHAYKHQEEEELEEIGSADHRDFEQMVLEASNETVLPSILSQTLQILTFMTFEGYETNYLEDHLLDYCLTEIDLKSSKGYKMAMIVLENLLYKMTEERLLNDGMLNLVVALLKNWHKHHNEMIRILNFLRDLVPLVFKTADEEKYIKFCKIISSCGKAVMDKYGSQVLVAFTHIVGTLVKMKFCVLRKEAEGFVWNEDFCKTIWKQQITTPVYLKFDWHLDLGDDTSNQSLNFPLFLKNNSNEVRMTISEYIPYIYMYDAICDEDETLQKLIFRDIVNCASQVFTIEEDLSLIDVREELEKRSCCALGYLTSIAAFSPTYRRKALYSFFQLIAEKHISIELAQKAMSKVVKVLNLSSLTKFLEENLNYILFSWYHKRVPFTRVPYRLLNCVTYNEFLLKYKTIIFPLLLEERDEINMKDISKRLESPLSSLITECFPEIMSVMLPKLGDNPNSQDILEMYAIVEREINSENMQLLLGKELDKVMIAVYEKLHDEKHFERLCGDLDGAKFPQMDRSSIKFSTIRSICSYLESRANTPNLLAYLGKEHPIHLHTMLHKLRANIQKSSTDETKYLYFQQYVSLAHGLIEILKSLECFGGYVVRGIVHQLLNLTKTNLEKHAVSYLFRFLSTILPHAKEYVDDLLPFIVPSMSAVIVRNKDKCEGSAKAAGQVLKLLMLDNAQLFPNRDSLDPLPRSISASQFVDPDIEHHESMRNMNQSLKECIEHFLKAGARAQDISFREQGLRHLHQKLCTKTVELHELYSELKSMRNFSEQCASSILHRLIISLVELATSKCEKVSELATICLGELGPRNLTTLVLKPQPRYKPPLLPYAVAKLLLPLLISENPDLAEAAVKTLQALFKTKEGYALVADANNCGDETGKLDTLELSYVTPFWRKSSKSKRNYSCETDSIRLTASLSNWCPKNAKITHEKWIKTLVVSILECCDESSFLNCLIPIAKSQVVVAEGLLPYLAKMILKYNDRCSPLLNQNVNKFFEKHYRLKQQGDSHSTSIYMDRAIVQSMLSFVNFYRLTELSTNEGTDRLVLNYFHVGSAAKYCNAYFTAILYSELWMDSELMEHADSEGYSIASPLDKLSDVSKTDAQVLQSLLWESYEKIGENDAVHGCGDVHIVTTQGRLKYYVQMKNWSQVVNECELLRDDIYNDYLVYALRMSGKYNMAAEQSKKHDYECAWRLSNWTLEANEDDYSGLLYSAIMSIQTESSNETRDLYVNKARDFVVENYLSHASLEVANSIYEPLAKLRTLREVTKEPDQPIPQENCYFTRDVDKWEHLEPILSARMILSNSAYRALTSLDAAALARKAGAFLIAHKFLQGAESFETTFRHQAALEEAKLLWESGCSLRAKYLLKELLTQKNMSPTVNANALITYGTWLAESKSELTKDIMKNHFEKAADLLADGGRQDKLLVADCMARFADSEYQRLQLYNKSNECARKQLHLNRCKEKLKDVTSEIAQQRSKDKDKKIDSDLARYKLTLEGQIKISMEELQSLDKSCSVYLRLATELYMKCLILGNDEGNDLKVFRLVSLCLDNLNSDSLMKTVENFIQNIPSYKFLIVLNQLIVRLTDASSRFNKLLVNIIKKCSTEHPHHSLPLVLALANSHLDETFTSSSGDRNKRSVDILEPRIKAVRKIVADLEKDASLGGLLREMQTLVTAYVSMANLSIGEKKSGDYKLPSSEPLSKIKNLSVPCLTSNIPVKKNGKYSNLAEIIEFRRTYGLVGGINSPKKLCCLCSDGLEYVQLVKGQDDLRQDAGMQQVFGILNILLRNEESTSKRRLLIRTYKVIPVSQKSGVIEWAANTQPIGDYLAGDRGAHVKYRPQDLSPAEARKKIVFGASKKTEGSNQRRIATPEEKYETYMAVCEQIKPVFRYFFIEKYPTPGVWFERRLAYTRSVATNSMIGYILGIGDRHVANILIDLFTAELVHIDFACQDPPHPLPRAGQDPLHPLHRACQVPPDPPHPLPRAGQDPPHPLPRACQDPPHPLPRAGQDPPHPLPRACQVPPDPPHPLPRAGQDPPHPLPRAGQDPSHPLPRACQDPPHPLPRAGQDSPHPLPRAGQDPPHHLPRAGQDPPHPLPRAGQDPPHPLPRASQDPPHPLPRASQDPPHPLPRTGQDPPHPLPRACQDPPHPLPRAGQDPPHPLPRACQVPPDPNHPLPRAGQDSPHHLPRASQDPPHHLPRAGQDPPHPLPRASQDPPHHLPRAGQDPPHPLPRACQDPPHPLPRTCQDPPHPLPRACQDPPHPLPRAGQDPPHPLPRAGQDPPHPLPRACQDPHHPLPRACQDPHHPLPRACQDPPHPLPRAGQDPHHPLSRAGQDPPHPLPRACQDPPHPLPRAGQDPPHPHPRACQDPHHPLPRACQDPPHPLPRAGQDPPHPLPRAGQDPPHPLPRACQDPPHPLPRAGQDPPHPLPRACQDPPHPLPRTCQDPPHPHPRACQDPHHPLPRACQDPPHPLPRAGQDPPHPLPRAGQDPPHPLPRACQDPHHPLPRACQDPPHPLPRAGQDPPHPLPRAGQDPPHPLPRAGQDPHHPLSGAGQDPPHPLPRACQDPPHPLPRAGQDPPHPHPRACQDPHHPLPRACQDPPHPLPRAGQDPPHPLPRAGQDPPHPLPRACQDPPHPLPRAGQDPPHPLPRACQDPPHPLPRAGITFEFGRFLPTPETIPFRLTRDIVDGMGVSGTEGIFKRCCEETLSVLRKTKDPILTTLEVFLYDPLATWESSVKKVAAKRVQKNQADSLHLVSSEETDKEGEGINTLAERCMQRLKEKLEGREDGNISSVEGQPVCERFPKTYVVTRPLL